MESFRDEKFTTRHKRHNPIPHSWLSSCGKIEIPHSRLRRSWGISISPRLLSHSWGIGKSLLWLVVNFQFLHLRLRRSCRNYPIPETFHKWIGSFIKPRGFRIYFIWNSRLKVIESTSHRQHRRFSSIQADLATLSSSWWILCPFVEDFNQNKYILNPKFIDLSPCEGPIEPSQGERSMNLGFRIYLFWLKSSTKGHRIRQLINQLVWGRP